MSEALHSTIGVLLITAAIGLSAYVICSSLDIGFHFWRWRRRRQFWRDYGDRSVKKHLTNHLTSRR